MKEAELDPTKVRNVGMDYDRVRRHQTRIARALTQKVQTTIPVETACSVEEGAILSWPLSEAFVAKYGGGVDAFQRWSQRYMATCVPAAGAASRYLKDLLQFVKEVEKACPGLEGRAGSALVAQGKDGKMQQAPQTGALEGIKPTQVFLELPHVIQSQRFSKVKDIYGKLQQAFASDFKSSSKVFESYLSCKAMLEVYGAVPKAAVETTQEGDTFLRLKLVEQSSIAPSARNLLIVPAKKVTEFEETIAAEQKYLKSYINDCGVWDVLEQGHELSTLRFCTDGRPFQDADGNYSSVSAGHGELVHIFESYFEKHPQLECLHLRNIDNIIGANEARKNEMTVLGSIFKLVREDLERIRFAVSKVTKHQQETAALEDPDAAASFRRLSQLSVSELVVDEITVFELYNGLNALFHWSAPLEQRLSAKECWHLLNARLSQPLSVFGVVKKLPGDVGGGPVFARLSDGTKIKLCMEMPHASKEDSETFFGLGGKATHFNPVLVFFETKTHDSAFFAGSQESKRVSFGQLFDERFWLLTHRDFQGESVCYHETVLYELLGNSARTNLLFVEVPRTLFNPHKTIFDSLGRDRKSYGFGENFESATRSKT